MKKCLISVGMSVLVTAAITAMISLYVLDTSGLPAGFVQRNIYSEILEEEREIIVDLPDSYEQALGQEYPVIYVLGGSTLTFHTAEVRDLMSQIEVMPEIIVVGLPNISQQTRQRDLTPPFLRQDLDEADSPPGEADAYLEFIEVEVIPLIENEYRTTSLRYVAGHSREGLLVMYSLMAKPDLFDARFAYSPALWREDNLFVTKFEEYLTSEPVLESFVYTSLGDQEDEKMTNAFNLAGNVLERRSPSSLHWHADIVPRANHGNNALRSTPLGFRTLYADWELTAITP